MYLHSKVRQIEQKVIKFRFLEKTRNQQIH